ncbi:MAG: hypothetical protein ACPGVG_10120 [Mycobacterium sp.]
MPTDVCEADTQASNYVCQFVDFMNKLMAADQSYGIEMAHRMGAKAERISAVVVDRIETCSCLRSSGGARWTSVTSLGSKQGRTAGDGAADDGVSAAAIEMFQPCPSEVATAGGARVNHGLSVSVLG